MSYRLGFPGRANSSKNLTNFFCTRATYLKSVSLYNN
jgi:hypothetical protein